MSGEASRKIHPRMMVFITPVEKEKKIKDFYHNMHIPIFHQCRGVGTAPSEILDIFGLGGTARLITVAFLPKRKISEVFSEMENKLSVLQKGGGIGFTIPVTGIPEYFLEMLAKSNVELEKTEGEEKPMSENATYSVIWISVESGYSKEVVEAARSAGAFGGTIIKGNRACAQETSDYLGIPLQEEQDYVMMIVPKEQKSGIMTAVSQACGLTTPAHGLVLALPVDEVVGLKTNTSET